MRNEYPRPSFVRNTFLSLNGERNFDFDDKNEGLKRKFYESANFSKKINVPFAYQTELSGINIKEQHEILWYERYFDVPDNFKDRTLINFNAVDKTCMVYLNGQFVGMHDDGYNAFSFDITDFLKKKNNHLVVRVTDENDPTFPRGKQYWEKEPSRCWYYPSSGIWQSVFLESYHYDYLKRVLFTPDIDEGTVAVQVETLGKASELEMEILFEDKVIKKISKNLDGKYSKFVVSIKPIDYIDELHYWEIKNPNLYDVNFKLKEKGEVCDEVKTYFALRKIHIDEYGNICLNNKKLYQRLVLDQGYWKDGGLTPSSHEEFKKDIELAKEMGFNGARKHQKIEDPYFYYYADKLGFLVWAELPSAYNFNYQEVKEVENTLHDAILALYNHPSIITWVPFNESWGIKKILTNTQQKNFVRGIYYIIKSIDSSRLVDSNDGWEHISDTDIIAIHDYTPFGDQFMEKYKVENLNSVQPMGRKLFAYGEKYKDQPVLLTEYGGFSARYDLNSNFFGYYVCNDKDKVIEQLTNLQKFVNKCNFKGFCYTQLTDVEQETNGLLNANHEPKFDIKILCSIFKDGYED